MTRFLRTIGFLALIGLVFYLASEGFKLANRAYDNEQARIENEKDQRSLEKKQLKMVTGVKAKPVKGFLSSDEIIKADDKSI